MYTYPPKATIEIRFGQRSFLEYLSQVPVVSRVTERFCVPGYKTIDTFSTGGTGWRLSI